MTDYKAIHGKNILHVASDLDNAEGEGQIWFNTTSNDYKTIVKVAGAWATGGDLSAAKYSLTGANQATQTAGLIFSGHPALTTTETYDGSSWTEVADLSTGRKEAGGAGTQTAALCISGNDTINVESWNGASWTEGPNVNTQRENGGAAGISTSALLVAGYVSGRLAICESWDGSSWTETGDIPAARMYTAATGATSSAVLQIGGNAPP